MYCMWLCPNALNDNQTEKDIKKAIACNHWAGRWSRWLPYKIIHVHVDYTKQCTVHCTCTFYKYMYVMYCTYVSHKVCQTTTELGRHWLKCQLPEMIYTRHIHRCCFK